MGTKAGTRVESAESWASAVFSSCDLGDARRVKRLVDYAGRQARQPAGSTSEVCRGSSAASEGAYRMLRSEHVTAAPIAEAMYRHAAEQARGRELVLAIEDSTSVSVHHAPLAAELAEHGCPTGFMVHHVLLVDFARSEPLGLIDQERWIRDKERAGKATRYERAHEDKESARWGRALERMNGRLESCERVVTVCDREADIYEFLQSMTTGNHRFVVRSRHDRVTMEGGKLYEEVSRAPVLTTRTIEIAQRGGQRAGKGQQARKARQARQAKLQVRASVVTLKWPRNRPVAMPEPLRLHVVSVTQVDAADSEEPLCWWLLTTEPIDTAEQVETIVRMYEHRWLIEELHKAWKTGCRLEERALQSLEAVEKMMVILAAVAVRILRMRSLVHQDCESSCEITFERDEWRCLWASTQRGKPIPEQPPDLKWAYYALARLGGFLDTKRTARPGWQTLWAGWTLLQERLIGWRLAIAASDGRPL